jgi:hypothetical protein
VKDENCDLLADSHNILNRCKNYFSLLLNVRNVSDVRQIEVHTAEPLVPSPSRLEVETAAASSNIIFMQRFMIPTLVMFITLLSAAKFGDKQTDWRLQALRKQS